MSIAIWPPIPAEELKLKAAETQVREIDWIVQETLDVCRDLKHGLEDCYALLAPIDPGSTLVISTPRNEKVKGTITRVGTRIVKGSLHLQLKTTPVQGFSLSPTDVIHIPALDAVHANLTNSIDLIGLLVSSPSAPSPRDLANTLSLVADAISNGAALLKGPPLTDSDPAWMTRSCPPARFVPPLSPTVSVFIGLQESSVVLWLRSLELVDAPVHFGTRLGLAIGTMRRLEHDEMDTVFDYNPRGNDGGHSHGGSARHTPEPRGGPNGGASHGEMQQVYVREKVRVESADPSLISLYSKLNYLAGVLAQAQRNLTTVMEVDE